METDPETDPETNPESNPLKEGALTENSKGVGTVTMKMIKDRAVEIAWMNGRGAHELKPADFVAANRELTGRPESDPNQEAIDDAPESARWEPVSGSTGNKVPVVPGEDEDAEGRSDNEKLVEEGMGGAEEDIERQAAKDAAEKDL